jgi:hypothetical protein
MNSQTQRIRDPAVGGELVSPLTDPNRRGIHAFDKAKRHWQKSLNVVVAEILAHERALLARLSPGIWAPPIIEDYERNEAIYHELKRCIREQIVALEAFAMVDWRE